MSPLKMLIDFFDVRLGVRDIFAKEVSGYLLPRRVNAWYTLGAVLLSLFGLQILTGILLLVYYVPHADQPWEPM
jgi:ubiquinol-cytochrome c reductase cytochrome b subunit